MRVRANVTRSACALLGVAAIVAAPVTARASAAAPAATPTGVVALYHLEEAAGATTMVDSSGTGHNGAIMPGVTTGVAGHTGKGYTNAAGGYVNVPSTVANKKADALNPIANALYISTWLKDGTAVDDYNVLEKGTATASGGAYKVEIGPSSPAKYAGVPDCSYNNRDDTPAVSNFIVHGPIKINDNTWHHVECSLVPAIGGGFTATIWVDGQQGESSTNTALTGIDNNVPMTVGGKPGNLSTLDRHSYIGGIDEICISVKTNGCWTTP